MSLVELYWGNPLVIIIIHLQTFIYLIAFNYSVYKWNFVKGQGTDKICLLNKVMLRYFSIYCSLYQGRHYIEANKIKVPLYSIIHYLVVPH